VAVEAVVVLVLVSVVVAVAVEAVSALTRRLTS
jgi:hypothetical protein